MTEEKPRYSRISDIIDLATYMQSKINGITIKDIEERYHVSRRTAIRMRDSLMNIFPSITEIETDDTLKHFGFYNYSIKELINFTPKEIANLEQLQRRTTNAELKNELGKTVEKLLALNKKQIENIENRVDLIMQTEGYAIRQMPQYKIDVSIIDTIRSAIQNSKKVTGIYHDKKRIIEPLGLIYGEKIFLIAREKAKGDDIYTYHLHKFSDLSLTEDSFDKQNFNLSEYSKQSFGIYHGEILNVKLQFSKDVATDVLAYNFHPTQKVKQQEDGSVIVKFKASGNREIIWHVFKWGKNCKILAPKSLKKDYTTYLNEILSNQ